MSNSDLAVTMYESDPVVAALNQVPGFDPLKLVRRKRDPKAADREKELDFRYKKLWFRLAHRQGRIRLNRLSITEQMAVYEAQIFLERTDDNPISSFTAACTREEAGGKYIEGAQIKAMDQALTDAGFGLQFVPAPLGIGNAAPQMAATPVAKVQTAATASRTPQPAVQHPAAQQTPQQKVTAPQSTVQTKAAAPRSTAQQQAAETVQRPTVPQEAARQKAAASRQPIQQSAAQSPVTAQSRAAAQSPATAQQPAQQKPVQQNAAVQTGVPQNPVAVKPQQISQPAPAPMPQQPEAAPATSDVAAAMSMLSGKQETADRPTSAGIGKEAEEKAYTESTPVEEILKVMTLEEAKKVEVPTGTCRGWTLNEVAEKRRPSLKFYLSEGYQGNNNILRAAARLVLDDLEQKAG